MFEKFFVAIANFLNNDNFYSHMCFLPFLQIKYEAVIRFSLHKNQETQIIYIDRLFI